MKQILSEARDLVVETWHEWNEDDAMQWGAAVSYYAALSLAPLLVTVVALAGLAFETGALRGRLVDQLGQWIGEDGASMAQQVLITQQGQAFAGVTSGVLALVGATAVFGQLQKALNQLWDVRGEGGIRRMLKTRLLGFAMIFCFGLLFLSALAMQAVLAALPEWGPSGRLFNFGGSVALFTLLFAAVYQILPDVDIRWRDVWVGAAVTAVLFSLGQLAVGLYLGRSSVGSSYGAAGSLVAVLVWLYYSSLVAFFGAEFTQVWARHRGQRIRPIRGAYRIETRRVEREVEGKGHPPHPRRMRVRGKISYP